MNVYDENNILRTYEYWSVNWSKNVIVNFTVVGLDNYHFDSIQALAGDYLDLTSYNVDGYKLSIKTSYGSTIYKGFIPEESGINVILTYEKIDDSNVEKSGCKGNIISSSIIISILSIIGFSLLTSKRKEIF